MAAHISSSKEQSSGVAPTHRRFGLFSRKLGEHVTEESEGKNNSYVENAPATIVEETDIPRIGIFQLFRLVVYSSPFRRAAYLL